MKQRDLCTRIKARFLYCAFLSALITSHCWAEGRPKAIAGEEIDRSVITALSRQGDMKLTVVSHVDLTDTFETATQWSFVVVQEASAPSTGMEDHGPIHVCLVKATIPDCSEEFYQKVSGQQDSDTPYHLFSSRIVYAGRNRSGPLLLIEMCGAESFDGDCGIATALYRYDRGADRFVRVFLGVTGRNNNQATRFVEHGPLQGDVIVVYPTENAPYTYWVELYRAGESGEYVRVLRYRGRTGYADGNPLGVADSEMPELMRRLGLWKPSDALPVPAHLPQRCSRLFMRDGEEWCK